MESARATDVLVVEDDAGIRGAVVECLEAEGYLVREAAGGADALRVIEAAGVPALVLLDVVMPGMRGDELLAALRGDPRTARVPIVVMTAALAAPSLEGADGLLPKPFDVPALLTLVARFCGPPANAPVLR